MSVGTLTSQFVTEGDASSALVRYLSDGEVSHVDLMLPTGELLGARLRGGVAIRPPGYRPFTKIIQVSCQVPDVDAAYLFATQQVGKPYNKRAILDMVLHRARLFTANQASWFCDELNYEIYLAGGVQLLNTLNPLWLTPQEELLSSWWLTRLTLK
jgi:hypothetical protein